jgi:hypothetical protein
MVKWGITITLPRYNWNIVDSGVRHHKPTNQANMLAITPKKGLNENQMPYNIQLIFKDIIVKH